MTPRQGQAAAFVCLVLGILGVWISKRPTTDIAAGVLGGAGFLLFMAPSVLRSWGNRQSRQRVEARRRAQREVPWTVYSRPIDGLHGMWEVGIERRTADGDVISTNPADAILAEEHTFDITLAVEEAKTKATMWTDNRVRM